MSTKCCHAGVLETGEVRCSSPMIRNGRPIIMTEAACDICQFENRGCGQQVAPRAVTLQPQQNLGARTQAEPHPSAWPGPGSELTRLLRELGFSTCAFARECAEWAAKMNLWGSDGCEQPENMRALVERLTEQKKLVGYLQMLRAGVAVAKKKIATLGQFPHDEEGLVREAVRRDRERAANATLSEALVINLARRPDRWESAVKAWGPLGIHLRRVGALAPGVEPDIRPPQWWQSETGAWYCMRSQIEALRLVADEVCVGPRGYALVLEDDAIPTAHWKELDAFFANLPPDWEACYLGGELIFAPRQRPPIRIAPGVLRALDCNRMHAYVVRPSGARKMLKVLDSTERWKRGQRQHCDHKIGTDLHRSGELMAYVPDRWLATQRGGDKSDIDGTRRDAAAQWPDPVSYLS